MKRIRLNLKTNPYTIAIGQNILRNIGPAIKPLKLGKDALIVTSEGIARRHGKVLRASLKRAGFVPKVFLVPDGERSKSAKEAIGLLERIALYDGLRRPFIVAFGGGVVGDLAGYVAAVYKRGIPYIQVPTTFLAQIDSAIGGKVAIDLKTGKNLVGAFYQPRIVFSDVALLKTLPKRQIKNGFAEVIKYGIIRDPRLFAYVQKHYKDAFAYDLNVLEKIVTVCSRIKAEVVLADEHETKGIRTILNYGHTAGHAIEAAGGFRSYQHGEAIGLGMRVAARISRQLRLLDKREEERINRLITSVGLPERIQKIKLQDILRLMKHDKKFIAGKNRFVLAKKIGKVCVREKVNASTIQNALKAYT